MTPEPFHPTAYTAALMLQLRRRAWRIAGASVAERGTGSGVVLATMCALGARTACGVDIAPEAVACTRALLSAAKLRAMNPAVHDAWLGRGLHRFGEFTFADVEIVEIGAPADAPPA